MYHGVVHNSRFYSFVCGTIVGIFLSSLVTGGCFFAVTLCLTSVIFGLISKSVIHRQQFLDDRKKVLAALLLACVFGLSLGAVRTALWLSFNHQNVLNNWAEKKVSLTAIVTEEPQISDASTKIIAETIFDVASGTPRTAVLITSNRYSDVKYGDEIKIFGKISLPKPIKTDGESFAYDTYLARQGIFYTMTFPSINIVAHHRGNVVREYLIGIKNNFLGKVDELFSAPRSGLLAGLLVSGRSSLSKSEQAQFTRAGLIHIVALSGFNVTIIAQGLMMLLIFLPKRLRLIIGAVGIIAFVTMAGFGATIVRAGIMALLVIAAALVYRAYNVGRALFMAVLCMTLWNPMVIFDVSFQLSCIATFAVIFAVNPAVAKYGPRIKFLPEKFKIRELMIGTAVIEIFLLPILLSTAGQISLVTIITNLLILPILPIVMGFGFLAMMVGYIHSLLALPIVAISNLMLEYILLITNFFANIPFGVVSFQIPSWAVGLMYVALVFWLWRLQKFQMQNQIQKNNILSASLGTPLTHANLDRLDSFFKSHSK